ncbi:23S rRNA (adenine(2503)-C(2))-methyltransferase RlmN [Thermosulfurimonas sp. F29]|uniref:23S rRNA (adenine(2503)-C(2))-methyltransferase RlmN n=1 Tax=Thermosulfurimonas sp. F29 TaxID=2867247 RepID=UPI001C82D8B1|nr:23S rRNA (adenine(2503)-C(2))-methyltransferase RlmN [Thermosulfurimonas sp. F29]MBX6422145.1 23S rRNA (adenine(2503)-C(2))-methyltransferase RlmN [Thermosulfurimonas sp. F29]
MKVNLRDLTPEELEHFMTDRGEPAYRGRQIFRWLARPEVEDFSQMTDLPRDLRERLSREASLELPETVERKLSTDGTVKLALRLRDGEVIECVLIPERDHYTLCVSTQVGCAMGCRFCLTGRMGFRRNLSPGEIVSQVILARRFMAEAGLEDRPLRNLVFMGMGEPLANYRHLVKALKILTHPKGFHFARKRTTVSTVGLVPQIRALAEEFPVALAISLHAPDNSLREKLIPATRRYPLEEILAACRDYPLRRGARITVEYVLLAGVNDHPWQARRLVEILRGIPSKVNLIPFNPHPELPFRRPSEERIRRFQEIILSEGLVATVRKSKGLDIGAACGQLRSELSLS